jgi:hypothetical protein
MTKIGKKAAQYFFCVLLHQDGIFLCLPKTLRKTSDIEHNFGKDTWHKKKGSC